MNRKSNHIKKLTINKFCKDEIPVQNGLSYTPSEMSDMLERGIAISSQNYENAYFDGVPNPSYNLDITLKRDTNFIDYWNASKDSKKSLNSMSNKHHILNYGDNSLNS